MKPLLTAAFIAAILTIPFVASADDMGLMTKGISKTPATASSAAYAASMHKMMADMAVKPTGDPDKDFVSMMLPHHQGAIDMAKVELKYGRDPMLRTLADDIVEAQEKEIAEMKDWQAKHGQ